jgi:2-keto-4-pentenoate hydratase
VCPAGEPIAMTIARELYAQRAARLDVSPLDAGLTSGGMPSAYAAQDSLFSLLHPDGVRIGGYKIGMGGRTIRAAYGLDQPASGIVASDKVLDSGSTIEADRFLHLAIECEVAVRIGRKRLNDGDADSFMESLDGVCAAYEIVDDRNLDYGQIDVFTMVADNGWNAGLVLGPVSTDVHLTREALEGRLSINGRQQFRGVNTDTILPLDAVVWLARHLSSRGRALEPGQWVVTGGLTSCFPTAGDELVFSAGPLDPVILRVC